MFLLMGSHLFDPKILEAFKDQTIVMIEDYGLCTHFRYHQLKIAFFLEAMRNYRDMLLDASFKVSYHELHNKTKSLSFIDRLSAIISAKNIKIVTSFSIEDKFFRELLNDLFVHLQVHWIVIESPLFFNSESMIKDALAKPHPLMRSFYEQERQRRGIMIGDDKRPLGGRYSFDKENRRKLPSSVKIPLPPAAKPSPYRSEIKTLVNELFFDHPGKLDHCWLPVTRPAARAWLKDFLQQRLKNFGAYEDAIDPQYVFIFHAALSPLLNCGLVTPAELLSETLAHAEKHEIPLNSLEGFLRQFVGWREFIRGIYEKYSSLQFESNFFNHQRKLSASWYDGTTGLEPLDDAIRKAEQYGYCHHIERLMILSNVMLLCEIHPHQVYRWFMEMFIDSADWVMGPNVFGMGQFSDGGLFTTKPYICGSNYILKMSSYKRNHWCDVLDGLYWRFIDKHRNFFIAQPRLAMMPRMLDRLSKKRKSQLIAQAEAFIAKNTR